MKRELAGEREGWKCVTIKIEKPLGTVIVTQDYHIEHKFGHYKGVLISKKGDVLGTYGTCCGAPRGKITRRTAEEAYRSMVWL